MYREYQRVVPGSSLMRKCTFKFFIVYVITELILNTFMNFLLISKFVGIANGKYIHAYSRSFLWLVILWYAVHLFCTFIFLPVKYIGKLKRLGGENDPSTLYKTWKIFVLTVYVVPLNLMKATKPLYYLSGGRSLFLNYTDGRAHFRPFEIWLYCNTFIETISSWILLWPFLIFESIFFH